MEQANRIKTLLQNIADSEESQFQWDNEALLKAYNQRTNEKSSLAIKILSVFGGFLASFAFLGFLFILGIYDSEVGMLILGAIFVGGSLLLNRKFHRLIIDTFSISIYLIGVALLIFGMADMSVHEDLITVLILIIGLVSLLISQAYVLSFIAVMMVNTCFMVLIVSNDLYNLIHIYVASCAILLTLCFLNEAKFLSSGIRWSNLYDPLRIGLVFSFLMGLIVLGKRDLIPLNPEYIWLSSIAICGAILYWVYELIQMVGVQALKKKSLIYLLSISVLLPVVFAPAISGAILIILLSFKVNHKTGLAIGIIALICFVSQFYYDLDFTLLIKSIILFSSGIVFLLFYLFTQKMGKS